MTLPTFRLTLTALSTALLAACGGGDDSPATTPPPTVTSVTLSGTAATTAPITTGTISAKCQNAAGTTPLNSTTGAYSLKIEGASLPCMVRVTSTDNATILHSAAPGAGTGTAVANVTPFTELIVAKAAGTSGASLYAIYDATTSALLSADKLAQAKTLLADVLKSVGIDISADAPLTDTFAAADTKGQKIAALETKLATGNTTLATLESDLINTSGVAATTPVVVAALTAPPVANCPAVRSVPYRIVESNGPGEVIQPNFGTGAVSTATTITFSSTTACDATIVSGAYTQQASFASSGLLLTSSQEVGQAPAVIMGFPEQTIPLADLVGTWNTVEYGIENARMVNFYSTLTIDAAGVLSVSECTGLAACVPTVAKGSITANTTAGGFNIRTPDGEAVRAFAFRGVDGKIMLAAGFDPGMLIAAKQSVLALPAVGNITVTAADVLLSGTAAGTLAVSSAQHTITAVDAASSTVTRTRAPDGRVDTLIYNSPRNGTRQRPAGSFGGSNFSGLVMVPTGVGIVAYGGITTPLFGVSLNR